MQNVQITSNNHFLRPYEAHVSTPSGVLRRQACCNASGAIGKSPIAATLRDAHGHAGRPAPRSLQKCIRVHIGATLTDAWLWPGGLNAFLLSNQQNPKRRWPLGGCHVQSPRSIVFFGSGPLHTASMRLHGLQEKRNQMRHRQACLQLGWFGWHSQLPSYSRT